MREMTKNAWKKIEQIKRSDERCHSSPSTKRGESALLFPNTRVKKHQLHVTEGDVG